MAAGQIIAWAQRWRGGIPGAIVRMLADGKAQLTELPTDGPPVRHPPMTIAEAMKLFERLTEVPHAREQAPPTDPHRGP